MILDRHQLAELLVKATNGCSKSASDVVECLTPYLRTVLKKNFTRIDIEDVEDIIQETFVSLFLKSSNFSNSTASLFTWAGVIAYRHGIDRYRSNRRHKHEYEPDFHNLLSTGFHKTDESNRLTFLKSAIKELSASDLEFINLHYGQGLTYENCAVAMNSPLGTIKSRTSRMITKLRTKILEHEESLN